MICSLLFVGENSNTEFIAFEMVSKHEFCLVEDLSFLYWSVELRGVIRRGRLRDSATSHSAGLHIVPQTDHHLTIQ